MNKIFLILCIMLFLTPTIFAELEIDEIRVYFNDNRYSGADEDGGNIDIKREDDLTLKIYLDNNWGNTSYIRLRGELEYIDDGDNIIEWKPGSDNWYDIDANDEISKTLNFKIPDDADYDEYDLDLTIYYNNTNGTDGIWDYSWDVIVEKDGEEESETSLDEIKTAIQNINCSDQSNVAETYRKLYVDCFTNYTICDDYRKENQEYKSKYDSCISAKVSCESANREWGVNYFLLNQTYGACIINRDNYSSQRVFFPFIIAILCIGGTYLYLKKGGEWKREGKMATKKEMTMSPDTRPDIHDIAKRGLKEKIKDKLGSQKEEVPDIREVEKRK